MFCFFNTPTPSLPSVVAVVVVVGDDDGENGENAHGVPGFLYLKQESVGMWMGCILGGRGGREEGTEMQNQNQTWTKDLFRFVLFFFCFCFVGSRTS